MLSNSYHKLERSICFVLIMLYIGVSAFAQIPAIPPSASDTALGGSNSIVGTVLGPSGRPVERRIRLRLSTMTSGDRISTTDSNGNFAFRGLPSGTYTVFIEKEADFDPYFQEVDIRQFRGSPPQVYTLNIRLKAKVTSEPKPGVVDASVGALPDRGRNLYAKAQDLAKEGDHKGAIEQLLLLTTEFPDFMLGFNDLGVAYLRTNDPEKADRAFRSALKIEPESFAPLTNLGMVLVSLRRFDEAELVLAKARKINEQSPVVHYFYGQALANLGRFDDAEAELVTAVRLGGDEMKEAHRILAIIYASRGDRKRAVTELENYLRKAPKAPDAEQLRETVRRLKEADTSEHPSGQEKKPR